MKNKRKILSFLLCLLALSLFFGGVSVSSESSAFDAQSLINEILDYKLRSSGAVSVQDFIDGELSSAAEESEWYALSLYQSGDYDFSHYKDALALYLENNKSLPASSKQKYALVMLAVGGEYNNFSALIDETVGAQGVMSYIFGLHLLNNGCVSDSHTKESVVDSLLSMQKSDGGWALMGAYGDTDVTAMVLQALAPYYRNENSKVKTAIDNALVFLSEKQLDDGDYISYGVANPESAAQVIIALSSLGIDAQNDERFIKNGNTLFNGILKYRLSDGSFSHTYGGESNSSATVQTFCAMTAYRRMLDGRSPFYILDAKDDTADTTENIPVENITDSAEKSPEANDSEKDDSSDCKKISYKVIACAIIVSLCAIACIVLFILKKKSAKNYIFVLVIGILAVCVVLLTNFESADSYYGGDGETKENVIGTVTLTVRCDTVAGRENHISADGVILSEFQIEIEDGDTVYDILIEAAKKHNILIESRGIGDSVYISGISNIHEFDFGDLSGWTYFVNGERPSVSCSSYKLKDGDTVEWHYSLELGNDIK